MWDIWYLHWLHGYQKQQLPEVRKMIHDKELISNEKGAVQGIPLSLMIAMTIVLIVSPLAFESLQNYSQNSTRNNIEYNLERLHEVALVVYSSQTGGYTSSLQHTMTISPYGSASIDHVRIGSDLRSSEDFKAYFLDYSINGAPIMIMNSEQQIPLMAHESGAIMIEDINSNREITLQLSLVDSSMTDPSSPCGGIIGIDSRFICVEVI